MQRVANTPLRYALILFAWLTFHPSVFAQDPVVIAVVTDGPLYQLQDVEQTFRRELTELIGDEFALEFKPLVAEWSASSVSAALETAYADASVDLVLVLGIAANQLTVSRPRFPKPTFLPMVFNPEIVGAPSQDNSSGQQNLNYLADQIPIDQDLAAYQRVSPFSNAVLVSDNVIIESLPNAPATVRNAASGVDISFLGHDGTDHDLFSRIPDGTEAVLLGGLPRLPADRFDDFLEQLAVNGIRSFSLVSEAEVERGALASYTTLTDFRRLARRNALNMQAVLLGERAQDQPISFEGKRKLTINVRTARRIGLSPRFDVLSEAELVDSEPDSTGPLLTLERVAEIALAQNLGLAADELELDLGAQDVLSARSSLLPQLSVSGSATARRDLDLTRGPGSAERSRAGALTLSQLVYSDAALSGYQQQKFLQEGREASVDASRLDQVFNATSAFLQALRADNQLAIQQENLNLSQTNLELARDRVRIGSASNADVYRWEANLAAARSNVLAARAQSQQARESINQLLNQPINQPLRLQPPPKDAPFVMSADEFDALIDNPRRYNWFVEFSIEEGLKRSPELRQIKAQLDAIDRDVVSKRREFWLPQFSVQAQYLDSLGASGRGSGSAIDTVNDWNVSLNASLPLFAGNARKAALNRSQILRRQVDLTWQATAERLEQSIRATLHSAQSSYINIELSQLGANASRKNLELVSEAYKQGSLSILDLLDAQNQSLQADLNANNAVHNFLIDIMNLQRFTARFDFLLDPQDREAAKRTLLQYIESRAGESRAPTGGQP